MRVLLTGGGTAGHINPALAIAQTIQQNDPSAVIEFVGIERGKETELVPREGFRLHFVKSQGFKRSLSPSNFRSAWLFFTSPYAKQTTGIIKEFQPDVVIGTGGFASWPLMAAAARMGIPTAVHESNSIPGLTVRLLQKKVDRIWTNFECTKDYLKVPKKILRVGNPFRGGFGGISREEARRKLGIEANRLFILSFGGSLGAENLNRAIVRIMKELGGAHPEILLRHAAGKRDYQATLEDFRSNGLEKLGNCEVAEYIYDMSLQMSAADLVICRAGAMTLSELALLGKASILIPSPYVAENHQYRNAKTLSDAGAAVLVEEKELESDALTEQVKALIMDQNRLRTLENNITGFADPEANKRIWEELLSLIQGKKAK